jgi:hypothetical protein
MGVREMACEVVGGCFWRSPARARLRARFCLSLIHIVPVVFVLFGGFAVLVLLFFVLFSVHTTRLLSITLCRSRWICAHVRSTSAAATALPGGAQPRCRRVVSLPSPGANAAKPAYLHGMTAPHAGETLPCTSSLGMQESGGDSQSVLAESPFHSPLVRACKVVDRLYLRVCIQLLAQRERQYI